MITPIFSTFRLADPPRSGFFAPLLRLYDHWMGGSDWIRLEADYHVLIPDPAMAGKKGARACWRTLTIPKGFTCDGASIPRFFWRVIGTPLTHDYIGAAVVHDYLYRRAAAFGRAIRRTFADLVLLTLLDAPRTSIRRWLIYIAVRAFGWRAWAQNSQNRYNDPRKKKGGKNEAQKR